MKTIKIFLIAVIIMFSSALSAHEFLNTIMHINVGFSYCFPFGNLIEHENSTYSIYSPYDDRNVHPTHYDMSINVYADLAPFKPFILGNESNAIKIGLRGGYRFNQIRQNLTINLTGKKELDYSGTLLDYDRWMIGPVLHYAPIISPLGIKEGYSAKGGLTFYLLFGQVVNAELTAYPAKRNAEGNASHPYYKTKCKGYAIDIGIGGEISVLSINLGLNVYYTYLNLRLNDHVYNTLGTDVYIHEAAIEVYMGIPIGWW